MPGVLRTAEGQGAKNSRLKANTMDMLSLGRSIQDSQGYQGRVMKKNSDIKQQKEKDFSKS